VLLGVWVLREPVTGSRLVGVILGLVGMLVLLGDEIHAVGRSPTGALLLILLLGEHPQWSDLAALVLVVAALAVVLLPQRQAA